MNEFNIADVVIIVFLIVCVYFYYNKGLVRTFLGFFTTLISTVLSWLLSPVLVNILRNTSMFESIKNYVGNTLQSLNGTTAEELVKDLNLPEFLQTNIIESVSGNMNPVNYISEYITMVIINIAAMIIVFLILFVILKILGNTLNIMSRLPVLKTANKIGGGVLGLAQGILVIWIALAVLTMLYGKPMFSGINEAVSNSVIASKFYDSNILIKGFSAIENLIP